MWFYYSSLKRSVWPSACCAIRAIWNSKSDSLFKYWPTCLLIKGSFSCFFFFLMANLDTISLFWNERRKKHSIICEKRVPLIDRESVSFKYLESRTRKKVKRWKKEADFLTFSTRKEAIHHFLIFFVWYIVF